MTGAIPTPTDLDRHFAIPGRASVIADPAGNAAVRIATEQCTGEISLHGAHVTSWKPAGQEEVIFLSSKASFAEGKAIRGGIPICFPWFRAKSDDAKAPAHGFARTRLWKLESVAQQSDGVAVTMSTESDDHARQWWPHEFRAQLTAIFGGTLQLEFQVTNAGTTPFRFEEALHTYYLVGDIASARVQGLDGAGYLDNTDGNREKKQAGEVSVSKATDSAYENNDGALEVIDPVLKRRIRVRKQNSRTTVIWNPWKEAAEKMPDMGANEWKKMLCVEGANILSSAITLKAGESHTTTVTMSVGPL